MEGQKLTIIKKIKKGGGAGHHGGSWKVAFADFMTAMMAFFLLMWLLSMGPQKKKDELANYFKTFSLFGEGGVASSSVSLSDSAAGKPQANPQQPSPKSPNESEEESEEESEMRAMKAKIEQDIREKLDNVKDQVVIDKFDGGIKVDIMDKAGQPMFHLGSTELTDTARKVLEVVAEDIKKSPRRIEIEGHTDALAFSGQQKFGNWELSTARASAARVALEQYGLSSALLVRVSGYADTDPIIKDNPFDPRNRRISLRILFPKDQETPQEGTDPAGTPPPPPAAGREASPTPSSTQQPGKGEPAPLVTPPAPPDIVPPLVR